MGKRRPSSSGLSGRIASSSRAVFLDRDGVLNEPVIKAGKPYPPASVHELVVTPGAREALVALRDAGFMLVCVTNQPDVARGTTLKATVDEIHAELRRALPLDDVVVCIHDDADACTCRKPQPGMIIDASRRHDLAMAESYLVGDRWRDIEAGFAAGCRTVFIDRGYRERAPSVRPDATVITITEAAAWILADARSL